MKAFTPLFVSFFLFGATLTAMAQEFPHKRGFVATISAIDRITDIHIRNLLRSNGISSTSEGSVIYGIEVPPGQTNEAIRILKSDAQLRGYQIRFGKNDVTKKVEKKRILSELRVEEVLARPTFASNTPLGIFLRSKYPVLTYLDVHERQDLSATNVFKTGYDIEIALSDAPARGSSGYRGWYQVYDEGREIASLGANEWSERSAE